MAGAAVTIRFVHVHLIFAAGIALVLAAQAPAAQNPEGQTPQPAQRFKSSVDILHGYLELFADAPEPLDLARVTLEVAETESSPALERVPISLAAPRDNTRCRIGGAQANVARLPPADYVARAVIAIGSRDVGRVVRPFRIER